MASPVRTLTVNFVGKTKDLDKAFKRVSKGSSLMSDRMARAASIGMGAFAGIGAAVAGAVMTLKPMIDAAADVDESLAKNRVLFGDAAAAAERFGESSAESFGISRREALEAVGVFGSLAHAMGMPQAEGVDLSVTMTKLAADMASFNNASVEETLTALQAGLRGEAEPLRRFGVLLDAATLKAKALEMGLIENEKNALTPQQKAMAAYRLILEQTAIQQGDFSRTSDGLANQQKKLAGLFDDIKVEIGQGLLPVLTDVTKALTEHLLPAFKTFIEDPSFESSGAAAGQIWWAAFGTGIEEASEDDTQRGFWTRIFTPPVFLAVGAVAAGVRWGQGFQRGVEESEIRARLAAIFDQVTADFGFDLEAVLNQEAMGVREEFTVEGWQPDADGIAASDAAVVADAIAEAAGFITDPEVDNLLGGTPATSTGPGSQEDAMDAFRGDEFPDLPPGPSKGGFSGGGTGGRKRTPEGPRGPSGDFLAPVAGFLASGGPPNTQITIIAPAVTGQEVWDAMGEAVKANGPMPPHWQQNAS